MAMGTSKYTPPMQSTAATSTSRSTTAQQSGSKPQSLPIWRLRALMPSPPFSREPQ